MAVVKPMGGLMMSTITAHTLVETSVTDDRHRFELTFVDARGEKHTVSIPSRMAVDLIPVLESLAGSNSDVAGPDFTRIPQEFEVGYAQAERMVLIRFDGEAPYGLGVEVAEALGRELQEQSDQVSVLQRPALH
jgi:hypothetical protein